MLDNCANLKLVSRALLVVLPEERHLVSREDFVESWDRPVQEPTSRVVVKSWEVEAP